MNICYTKELLIGHRSAGEASPTHAQTAVRGDRVRPACSMLAKPTVKRTVRCASSCALTVFVWYPSAHSDKPYMHITHNNGWRRSATNVKQTPIGSRKKFSHISANNKPTRLSFSTYSRVCVWLYSSPALDSRRNQLCVKMEGCEHTHKTLGSQLESASVVKWMCNIARARARPMPYYLKPGVSQLCQGSTVGVFAIILEKTTRECLSIDLMKLFCLVKSN